MPETITKPGIYHDFPEADYFADPCPTPSLTQSVAKVLIDYSPGHARLEHPRLAPPKEVDEAAEKYVAAQAIGNAAHKIMLGRGREIAEVTQDSFRSDKAKLARVDAEKSGKLPILTKHLVRAADMVRAARRQLDAMGLGHAFNDGHGETMIAWKEGDLWLRSLIDWYGDLREPFDYKTTGLCCAPHAVAERPSEAGWDIQAACHERGLDVLDPDNAGRRTHWFVAQENFAPYALSVVQISESDLTMGRKKLAYAIEAWTRCVATNTWPLYMAEPVVSRPRGYLETKWLERETEDAERKASVPGDILMAG